MQPLIISSKCISLLSDQFTSKPHQYEQLWRAKRRNRIDASLSHATESLQMQRSYKKNLKRSSECEFYPKTTKAELTLYCSYSSIDEQFQRLSQNLDDLMRPRDEGFQKPDPAYEEKVFIRPLISQRPLLNSVVLPKKSSKPAF